MTPLQSRKGYLSDTLGTFDDIVTFSSVEHTGLGRYGTPLIPGETALLLPEHGVLQNMGVP